MRHRLVVLPLDEYLAVRPFLNPSQINIYGNRKLLAKKKKKRGIRLSKPSILPHHELNN